MQKLFFLFVIVACKLISCKKPICDFCPGGNKPPVAIAGRDTTITLPVDSLVLDGSASHDPDGGIKNYFWRNISNLPCTISNHQAAKATIKNLVAGIYKFELEVTDDLAFSTKDTVLITVLNGVATPPPPPPSAGSNKPPIANAGADQTITSPQNWALLDGSLSQDPDGNIVSFDWLKVAGPDPLAIDNPNSNKSYTFGFMPGVYQFEILVGDNNGATARDTMNVTVLPDSLTKDQSTFKRFNRLQWGNSCTISIHNISSAIPAGARMQVFIRDYYENPWHYWFLNGWVKVDEVKNSSYWYEIQNDMLIIHAPANLLCDWDDSHYDVLLKWN